MLFAVGCWCRCVRAASSVVVAYTSVGIGRCRTRAGTVRVCRWNIGCRVLCVSFVVLHLTAGRWQDRTSHQHKPRTYLCSDFHAQHDILGEGRRQTHQQTTESTANVHEVYTATGFLIQAKPARQQIMESALSSHKTPHRSFVRSFVHSFVRSFAQPQLPQTRKNRPCISTHGPPLQSPGSGWKTRTGWVVLGNRTSR